MAKPMPGWFKVAFALSGVLVAITGLKKLKDEGFIRDEPPPEKKAEEKP